MINKLKLFIAATALLLCSWTVHAAGTVRLVTNANDSGDGSLRAAIAALGGNGGLPPAYGADVDTIRFELGSNLHKGDTIVFLTPILTPQNRNFVIDGEDKLIVLSGNNLTNLFEINTNLTIAEISNLTLTAGFLSGNTGAGAVKLSDNREGGAITFNNVRFEGNTRTRSSTPYGSGAIYLSGTESYTHVVINHCTFIKNKVLYSETSSFNLSLATLGGGAIYAATPGNVEISNCLFEENSSISHGGAIAARNATITGCIFKNNSAAGSGGAVALLKNTTGASNIKLLGNTFIGNTTEGATYNNVTYNGAAFGTFQEYSGSSAEFAGNVFQDNIDAGNPAYNEFYHSHANVAVTSGGYNVFKGAVPATAANTWTSADTDRADNGDIVNATNGRISVGSPAFGIIPAADANNLITGLSFPATDIFDQASGHPNYNAGADQGDGLAGLSDITVEQLLYQNGDEHDIGIALVGTDPLSLVDIAFTVPASLEFTAESATLRSAAKGETSAFSLSGISLGNSGEGTDNRLLVTVNFTPTAEQEYLDTLVIAANGANDFVLPLRGTGISWTVAPVTPKDLGLVAVGKSSTAQPVTITGSGASGAFSYSLKGGAANASVFPVTEVTGYDANGLGGELEIRFTPAAPGVTYKDTLVIVSAGSDRSYEIALAGTALPVAVAPEISFGSVVISAAGTFTLPVTVASHFGIEIDPPAITAGSTDFTVVPASNWSTDEGGDLLVTFTPSETGLRTATLTLDGEGTAGSGGDNGGGFPYTVELSGTGLAQPVISSDSAKVDFGRVVQDETASKTFTVTLAHAQSELSLASFSLAGGEESVYGFSFENDVVTVTFTPPATGEYKDTLIVNADYAEELRIPLVGEGFKPSITADSSPLAFGNVPVGGTDSETLTVTLSNPASDEDELSFTLAEGDESVYSLSFDEDEVTVTFTPLAAVEYNDTLIINADYADEVRIPLVGEGFKPEVSSVPDSLDFEEVEIGQSASATLTVTQENPFAALTQDAFSLAVADGSIFGFSFESPSTVTVTFSPSAAETYLDTLVVNAAYADAYRIPLVGTGKLGTGLSVPQESGIYLSVREGAIVVHSAPVNSRIVLYSLQGVATLAQTVTSNEEILKTSGFARGVYILAVRNEKGEILKKLKVKN